MINKLVIKNSSKQRMVNSSKKKKKKKRKKEKKKRLIKVKERKLYVLKFKRETSIITLRQQLIRFWVKVAD